LVALPSTGPDVEEGVGVPGDGVGVEVGDGDPAGACDPDAVAFRTLRTGFLVLSPRLLAS
jgi:hypothetical protein